MSRRIVVNAVNTNLLEILGEQVQRLKDVSENRTLDKTECLLLKLCMDLHATKLDVLESFPVISRTIQSEEERQSLLALALKN